MPESSRPPEPATQERHDLIRAKLRAQIAEAPTIGPEAVRFSTDLFASLESDEIGPHLWDAIDNVWLVAPERGMTPDRKAEYIVEQLPRASSALLLPEDPDFIHHVHWPDLFASLEDRDKRFIFVTNTIFPIQSNVGPRGKLFDFELKIHGITEDVVALELGAGAEYIGKSMVANGPWPPTTIMERQKKGSRYAIVENTELSQEFNEVGRLPINYLRYTGTDIYNPNDPIVKNWRLACSLYLDERKDPERVAENNRLEDLRLPNVHWLIGDITAFTPEDYRDEIPDEPLPHLTFASFVLYLLNRQEQRQGVRNLANFALKSKGIAAVFDDIVSIDPNHQPTIVSRKRDYSTTSLWVFNGRKPGDGWVKHASVKTGRAESLIYESDQVHAMAQRALRRAARRRLS